MPAAHSPWWWMGLEGVISRDECLEIIRIVRNNCLMSFRELQEMLAIVGWNQSELARRAGVDPDSVSRWKKLDRCPLWVRGFMQARVAIAEAYREHVSDRR